MNIISLLKRMLCRDCHEENSELHSEREYYKRLYKEKEDALRASYERSEALLFQVTHCTTELEKVRQNASISLSATPVDEALGRRFKVVDNIAYRGKRDIEGTDVPVWLNQMITPDSYVVQREFQPYLGVDSIYNRAQKAGDYLAKKTTWVDEKKLYKNKDYYQYPEETLLLEYGDCEDFSFTFASWFPDRCGVCYGFYTQNGERFGHGWPVVLTDEGEFYIVETTGNRVQMSPFNNDKYEPYFIVTKSYTYMVKSGVRFGKIAS